MTSMHPLLPIHVFILTSVTAMPAAFATDIIAHRGASADAPENTMAAFRAGYAQEADAIELDVHLSKDGQAVVIHDVDTKRVAGVDRPVVEQTLEELLAHSVGDWGQWKGRGFEAERIPTLDEVLAIVPDDKRVVIEIKCGAEALPAVESAIRKAELKPAQTLIITFKLDVAVAAKMRFPDRQVYWLHSYKKDEKTGAYPDLDALIARAKEAGLDGLNLNYNFPLDKAAVDRIRSAGLKCYVWTVNDTPIARRLVEAGVDGITTDRPGALRRELASPPAEPAAQKP